MRGKQQSKKPDNSNEWCFADYNISSVEDCREGIASCIFTVRLIFQQQNTMMKYGE